VEVPNWRLHDIRRTGATHLQSLRVPSWGNLANEGFSVRCWATHAEGLGWRVVPISGDDWDRCYWRWVDQDGCIIPVCRRW